MSYQAGQIVAVKIPIKDQDEGNQWVVAKYIEERDGQLYAQDTYSQEVLRVSPSDIKPFPEPNLKIKKGDVLLSLWYDVVQQQWTNVLYPCTALQDYPCEAEPEAVVFAGRFEGDPTEYHIHAAWTMLP